MERVRRLEEKATSVTQILGGYSGLQGHYRQGSGVRATDCPLKNADPKQYSMVFASQIESYIESIEESEMRQIFRLRYLEGKT